MKVFYFGDGKPTMSRKASTRDWKWSLRVAKDTQVQHSRTGSMVGTSDIHGTVTKDDNYLTKSSEFFHTVSELGKVEKVTANKGRSISTILREMIDGTLIRATKSSKYSPLPRNASPLRAHQWSGGRTIESELGGRRQGVSSSLVSAERILVTISDEIHFEGIPQR